MTMKPECPPVSKLQLLLDQELDPGEGACVESHIAECKICQDALDTLTGDAFQSSGTGGSGGSSKHLQRAMLELKSQSTTSQHGKRAIRGLTGGFPERAKNERALGAIGRYDILREIGAGAIGVLFEAWDNELNRKVAIKVLRDIADSGQSRERLLREARANVQLRHENVVEVYDIIDRDDFQPSLVMELMEGGSVADLLRAGPVHPTQAASLVLQAALGVEQAHQAQLIHRDIKPSNLMLAGEEVGEVETAKEVGTAEVQRLAVADFGLVSMVDADSKLTQTGEIAGTPAYMSPEQVERPSGLSFASDVYSLGCVLYELLTGRVPFDGTVRMVLWQVLHEEPMTPSRLDDRIPKALEAICLKAMNKNPERRYSSAQALADDLRRFLVGNQVEAKLPGLLTLGWRSFRKYPAASATIALSTVMILTVAIISTFYALWLSNARRETELQARKADRGQEVALEVLEAVVFDAYDELDKPFYDPDEMQIKLLEAAAKGLGRIETEQKASETLIKRAETHARLARALYRMEQSDESSQQLGLANEMLAKIPMELRQSEPGQRLQLQIWIYEITIAEEFGDMEQAEGLRSQALAVAEQIATREDASVLGLRVAAEAVQWQAYSLDGSERERAAKKALEIHKKAGAITTLQDSEDILLRWQLLRELAEVYYFNDEFARSEVSWRIYREAVVRIMEKDESEGFEPDPSAVGELLHADAGLAASEIGLEKVGEARERLTVARQLFERERDTGLHVVEVSEGFWQLVDTALEEALVEDLEWELAWLQLAETSIDQEAGFHADLSLLDDQIFWKERLLECLRRNELSGNAEQQRTRERLQAELKQLRELRTES